MPTLRRFPGPGALAQAAAELLVGCAKEAIAERGVFRAALSGGHDPRGMFSLLAANPPALDWSRVELYWVDERWVPVADPESNYGEAGRLWLDGLAQGPARFPMYDGAVEAPAGAEAYARLLRERFASPKPVFDLALMGMGPDGHTASLFPGAAELEESQRLCLALRHPASGQWRVTLTLPVINAARRVAFLVDGAEKAGLLAGVLDGSAKVPAARVRPLPGELLWMVDAAAAAQLPRI